MRTIQQVAETLQISRQAVEKLLKRQGIQKHKFRGYGVKEHDFERICELRGIGVNEEIEPQELKPEPQQEIPTPSPLQVEMILTSPNRRNERQHPVFLSLNESEFNELARLKRRGIHKAISVEVENV